MEDLKLHKRNQEYYISDLKKTDLSQYRDKLPELDVWENESPAYYDSPERCPEPSLSCTNMKPSVINPLRYQCALCSECIWVALW